MAKKKTPTKSKKKKEVDQDRDCEDWCFVCKDGGELILCDHEDCVKVYHKDCVNQDDSAAQSGHWKCDRHSCFQCHKPSNFYCYCCPNAVCRQCIGTADFAPVRGKNGFCEDCLDLVLIVEERDNLETEEGSIDLQDRNTHECLFLEYWDIIKEEGGLTLEDVYEADAKLRKGLCSTYGQKSKKKSKRKEVTEHTSSDSDIELEDLYAADAKLRKGSTYGKKSKKKSKRKEVTEHTSSDSDIELEDSEDSEESEKKGKRKSSEDSKEIGTRKGSKSYEFIGWGSKPLIEFLRSLGKDTTKELPRYEIDSIISHYIQEKKLFDPRRRKKIICDEMLYSLFRKKVVQRNKIYRLLEPHFLENLETSEEVEVETLSHERNDKTVAANKRKRTVSFSRNSDDIDVGFKVYETGFASIVAENIKLVYLRKSLVVELLNDPESIEAKIVGTFVKVKNDSKDLTQRSSYHLVQVTGIERKPTDDEPKSEIFLKLSNTSTAVRISTLSDADLCEEEIDDLRQEVEKGLIPKLTVVELEQKAKELHVYITKNWIEKELIRLQKLINIANEKGWRRELHEYLEQRELLEKPSEQERLIQQTPKVTPEVMKVKLDLADAMEVNSDCKGESPQSILFGTPKSPGA